MVVCPLYGFLILRWASGRRDAQGNSLDNVSIMVKGTNIGTVRSFKGTNGHLISFLSRKRIFLMKQRQTNK